MSKIIRGERVGALKEAVRKRAFIVCSSVAFTPIAHKFLSEN